MAHALQIWYVFLFDLVFHFYCLGLIHFTYDKGVVSLRLVFCYKHVGRYVKPLFYFSGILNILYFSIMGHKQ